MERKTFLKSVGLAGFALSLEGFRFADGSKAKINSCVLIPTETAGPLPLDLTTNSFYFRQDVRETRAGTQLNLKMRVIGNGNCLPMPNVRVNIWHCDKDGQYSGYSQSNNPGQAGLTYL